MLSESLHLMDVGALYGGPYRLHKTLYFNSLPFYLVQSRMPLGQLGLLSFSTCKLAVVPAARMQLACRPRGILNVKVRTLWLPNSQPEQDTMTDISCLSLGNTQSLASSIEQVQLQDQLTADHVVSVLLAVGCRAEML